MRLCTRPACALLLAAATTAAGLAFAPAASADGGDITIISVSPPPATQPPSPPANAGQITVETQSGSPIIPGSMTVHLFDGLAPALPSVTGFALIGESNDNGEYEEIWQLPADEAITAKQLQPGTYTATVDASDLDGSQPSRPGGSYPFLIQPSITLAASPPSISYTQQTVKFSGLATEIVPGTISPVPFAGQQIQIIGPTTPANPSGAYSATTDSLGQYQLSIKPQTDNYYADIQGGSSMTGARSSLVAVTASPTPIRLAAKFASTPIQFGRADTLTGTLRYYQSAKTLKPLPGAAVIITRLSPPGQPRITVKTNSAGGFRASIPRQTATGTWAVSAGGTTLLGKALVTRTLTVHQTTSFRRTSIKLSAFGVLTVKSCLVDTSPGRSGNAINAPVALQYGPSRHGRWKQFVTIERTFGTSYCPGRAPAWTITVRAPAMNAYYRLRFAGTQTLRVSVSKVAHLWRDATRITSFKVSPQRVHAKGAITISGRLWRAGSTRPADSSAHPGGWTPYADRKVAIFFVYRGQSFAFNVEPKTNSSGDFKGLFTAFVTARWLAQYGGDGTHFGSDSKQVKVEVSGGSAKLLALAHLLRTR